MAFDFYVEIDYSGAKTPSSRLTGLQVYAANGGTTEKIFSPASSPTKTWNWTRQEIAYWLIEQLQSNKRIIAGIDHGFSFPLDYFQRYKLKSWADFLEDFVQHWPTQQPSITVDSIRQQHNGFHKLPRK